MGTPERWARLSDGVAARRGGRHPLDAPKPLRAAPPAPRARKNDKDADLPPKQRPGSKGCVGHAFPPLPFGLPAREEAPRLRAATGSRFCSLGTFPGHETPRAVSPRVPHRAGVSVPGPPGLRAPRPGLHPSCVSFPRSLRQAPPGAPRASRRCSGSFAVGEPRPARPVPCPAFLPLKCSLSL